jgi:hypothetical protein
MRQELRAIGQIKEGMVAQRFGDLGQLKKKDVEALLIGSP